MAERSELSKKIRWGKEQTRGLSHLQTCSAGLYAGEQLRSVKISMSGFRFTNSLMERKICMDA